MTKHIIGWAFLLAAFSMCAADKDVFDYAAQAATGKDVKKIVFIADPGNHGSVGSHEFIAGSIFIARTINAAYPNAYATVYSTGKFPADLSNADAVVVLLNQADRAAKNTVVKDAANRGAGFGALHYGVEVSVGEPGENFLKWLGGYFEIHWSVNPTWTAKIEKLPDHPVARGVKSFEANDEWYYHMRFVPDMKGVTPILSTLPPESTLKRNDSPHANNPNVRAAVLERKEPQVLSWVYERPEGGGRGFGFTGLHNHFNLKIDGFRKTLINGVAWIAKLEIPADGVPSETPTDEQLKKVIDDGKAFVATLKK